MGPSYLAAATRLFVFSEFNVRVDVHVSLMLRDFDVLFIRL